MTKLTKSPPFDPFVSKVAFVSRVENAAATGRASVAPASGQELPADLICPVVEPWSRAFAFIDPDTPPNGFPERDWRTIHRDGLLFLSLCRPQAAELGWTTIDVFGVHRNAPTANYAAMGLVPVLRGAIVVAMTAVQPKSRTK
ncbi:MAG: hypothetical protein RLO48_18880 [Bauldia litoralis]